jgi:hypothetical protein
MMELMYFNGSTLVSNASKIKVSLEYKYFLKSVRLDSANIDNLHGMEGS